MADVNSISKILNNLNTSTLVDSYSSTVTDNIFDNYPVWQELTKNQKFYDGGTEIVEPLSYATLDGQWYKGLSSFNADDKETLSAGKYLPAYSLIPVMISETDMLENSGKSAIINLLEYKFENARMSLEKFLSDAVWSNYSVSAGIARLWGLQDIIKVTPATDPTGGDYGGIDATVQTWWQNQYKDSTSFTAGSITIAEVQRGYSLVSIGKTRPTLGITCQEIWDRLYAIADGQTRYGTEAMRKIGCDSLSFNGVPLIVDEAATANQIRWMNNKHLFLKTHRKSNFTWSPFQWSDSKRAIMKVMTWAGQVVCNNRRTMCVQAVS
jgi:hypothetical protein